MFSQIYSANNNNQTAQLRNANFSLLHNWLESLPLTQISRSTQLMIQKVEELSDSQMTKRKIFESMELLRPTIKFIDESLQNNFSANFELPRSKRRGIIDLAQKLQMALVDAYSDLAYNQDEYLDQAIQATCIHRAMVHITKIMLQTYHIYAPIEAQLWLKLYALYHATEKRQLQEESVFDDSYPDTNYSTITMAFSVPLLLATANPYQLRIKDISGLFNSIALWAKHVVINSKINKADLFVISVSKDSAPLYQKLFSENKNTHTLRSIDFSHVCNHLTMLLESLNSDREPSLHLPLQQQHKLSKSIIEHLIRSWGTFPDRAFPRQKAFGDIKASIGLSATHYFINNKQPIARDSTENDPTPINNEQQNSANKYQQHDWQLINSSSNGYCLCTTVDYPQTIEIGSIIGLQEEDQDNKCYWHIGVIRWIKFNDADECQVGVQLIAPNALAVGIQSQQQRANNGDHLHGLLLPELKAFAQPTTLVTPSLAYQVGNIIHIINDNIDSDVKLTTCVDETQRFKQFTFEILKHFAEVIRFDSDPKQQV